MRAKAISRSPSVALLESTDTAVACRRGQRDKASAVEVALGKFPDSCKGSLVVVVRRQEHPVTQPLGDHAPACLNCL